MAAPGERARSTARRRPACAGPGPLSCYPHGGEGGGNELSMSGVPGQPAGGQWSGALGPGKWEGGGGDAKLSLGLNNPTLPSQLAIGK